MQDGDYGKRLVLRRLNNGIVPHQMEPERTGSEIWTYVSLLRINFHKLSLGKQQDLCQSRSDLSNLLRTADPSLHWDDRLLKNMWVTR